MDILMTGYVACGGISCILNYYENELKKVLPVSLINSAKKIVREESEVSKISDIVRQECSNAYVYAAGEGGVYRALWEIAEENNISGLTVRLKDMTIKQEFIEISEYFNINPYMLNAKGVYIIATEDGNRLCRFLVENGIICSVIGFTTENNGRVIVNGDEKKYIDSRIKDELTKLEGLKDERKNS